MTHPHLLDAAPLGPLREPWPRKHTWVCVWLSERWQLLVGPRARWRLIRAEVGRVAEGDIGEA